MEPINVLERGKLINDKHLNLSCGLQAFPLEITELADSLEILDLSNNQLRTLPEAFSKLKNLRIVFFNNNQFEDFPAVLSACPKLSMVSFKNNRIETISEQALAPTIRWLTLTNNRIRSLPNEIGRLSQLQKLMLAGNQLTALPDALAACKNLELIRLSANCLQALPDWLLHLPRLSWLAYAGNPFCQAAKTVQPLSSMEALPTADWGDIQLGEPLGEGASGVIYRGIWAPKSLSVTAGKAPIKPSQAVAVKLFKGSMTSDGLPLDEMSACIAAGTYPNLVPVLGRLGNHPEGKSGLVLSLIPPGYRNLGNPPSLETCTRDTYPSETIFTLSVVLRISRGIAAAVRHLHSRGIMHGDLYAHNILIDQAGESLLSDFGAASFYDRGAMSRPLPLEQLEVRAYGCLLEDLLDRCRPAAEAHQPEAAALEQLRQLYQDCMSPRSKERPTFAAICERLDGVPQ